jgi:hypothetical protein
MILEVAAVRKRIMRMEARETRKYRPVGALAKKMRKMLTKVARVVRATAMVAVPTAMAMAMARARMMKTVMLR